MQKFDYQFNVGGNFTATTDGMTESAGRFSAAGGFARFTPQPYGRGTPVENKATRTHAVPRGENENRKAKQDYHI